MDGLSCDDFLEMLHELDCQLTETITIRAIGGFSIMLHARAEGRSFLARTSQDADSMTRLWSDAAYQRLGKTMDFQEIENANRDIHDIIWEIGERHHCNACDGWLNNSWYDAKVFHDELEQYVRWQKYDGEHFDHIRLLYADLESLFLFKMRAIQDAVLHRTMRDVRVNDVYDISNIMRVFGERDLSHLKHHKMAMAAAMYPEAVRWLERNVEFDK